jgi:hypothetical protein
MDSDKPSRKARLREARVQLKDSLAAQRALACRVAELETLRASDARTEAPDAREFFDLATRLASAERAVRAAMKAGAGAIEASDATQTLLAAAGARLAELGGIADRADLAEDRLFDATATIEALRDELTEALAAVDETRETAARLDEMAQQALAKAESSERQAEQARANEAGSRAELAEARKAVEHAIEQGDEAVRAIDGRLVVAQIDADRATAAAERARAEAEGHAPRPTRRRPTRRKPTRPPVGRWRRPTPLAQ